MNNLKKQDDRYLKNGKERVLIKMVSPLHKSNLNKISKGKQAFPERSLAVFTGDKTTLFEKMTLQQSTIEIK